MLGLSGVAPDFQSGGRWGSQFCWKDWSQEAFLEAMFLYGTHCFYLDGLLLWGSRELNDGDYGDSLRLFNTHCSAGCRRLLQIPFPISVVGKSKEYHVCKRSKFPDCKLPHSLLPRPHVPYFKHHQHRFTQVSNPRRKLRWVSGNPNWIWRTMYVNLELADSLPNYISHIRCQKACLPEMTYQNYLLG